MPISTEKKENQNAAEDYISAGTQVSNAEMKADEYKAIQLIQQARFSSDPNSLAGTSVTLKVLREWEQKATEVYTEEQNGVRLGVKERTAQFMDRLITRMAEKPATREAMMADAAASIERARQSLIQARLLEDKLRSDPRADSSAREDAKETRKAAEYANSWDVVPPKDVSAMRPLAAERSAALMEAVAIAVSKEQRVPSASNRYQVATIEEELNYRRREVASGSRSPDDMRPERTTPENKVLAFRVLETIPTPSSLSRDQAKSNEPESLER
jgi:hypothetical protein